MKAVVTEIKNGCCAVLLENGQIKMIENDHYVTGQVIDMRKKASKKTITMWISAAAVFVLAAIGGLFVFAEKAPATYVSLDVNPSIEFTLNRFDKVLSAKAVNDDGAEIIKAVNLNNLCNKTIDDAIKTTVSEIKAEGYFNYEDSGIVITTSASDLKKSTELADKLKSDASAVAGDNVSVEAQGVGKERVEEARKLGTTPGKLNLVEKLQATTADPDNFDKSAWLDKPVKEIMKEIKANKKADKADNSANSSDNSSSGATTGSSNVSESANSETTASSAAGNTDKNGNGNDNSNANANSNKNGDKSNNGSKSNNSNKNSDKGNSNQYGKK